LPSIRVACTSGAAAICSELPEPWLAGLAGGAVGYAANVAGSASEVATSSGPGEGERLWFVGTLATIRVPGEVVDGRFALIEFLFPHHASPPLHTHPQDESYFVLEGRLTVQAGDRRFELEAGAAAVFPPGTVIPDAAAKLLRTLAAALGHEL